MRLQENECSGFLNWKRAAWASCARPQHWPAKVRTIAEFLNVQFGEDPYWGWFPAGMDS
jgi:hypothetical protein